MNIRIISAIFILALVSLACGFSVDLPSAPTPGPLMTEPINVPAPDSGGTRLKLEFGAGKMKLAPGGQAGLVEGTAKYNIADLKPEVTIETGSVLIKQGDYTFKAVPDLSNHINEWDLKLGNSPIDLSITAGAYNAEYELGGLALTGLTIQDGAAKVALSFSQPNQSEMAVLRYETGASNVKMEGLGNANFNTMVFQSGAGDYSLDFSGELKRNATISIRSGLGNLILRIPEGVAANLTTEGALTNISTSSSWNKNENLYTQEGSGPTLTFLIEMSAGNLTITN